MQLRRILQKRRQKEGKPPHPKTVKKRDLHPKEKEEGDSNPRKRPFSPNYKKKISRRK